MRYATIDNAAARRLLQDLFVTEADLRPEPSAGLLQVEIHRDSRPVVERTLTALLEQLNEMECHRAAISPLRPNVFAVVRNFLRGGDRGCGVPPQAVDGASRAANSNAAATTTPPACHQRRARQTAAGIASCVCHEVPRRQFVFTIPRVLRGIFRKRSDLLGILFQTATKTLRDSFRARLNLPDGLLAAVIDHACLPAGRSRRSPSTPSATIRRTFEPSDPPWRAIKEWLPDDGPPDRWNQRPHPAWQPVEIPFDDERTLVLEAT
ncbi:MAG: hypothetical protein NTW21_24160 [Verrucomicrobia bacterium]|nr:hypothetical protein [Verrucomicrobiota bacterium]